VIGQVAGVKAGIPGLQFSLGAQPNSQSLTSGLSFQLSAFSPSLQPLAPSLRRSFPPPDIPKPHQSPSTHSQPPTKRRVRVRDG
jgi:hypothetical protein